MNLTALILLILQPTIDDKAGLSGVGGAKVVGDDALVTALVSEGDMSKV